MILTSPLVRARQTADILGAVFEQRPHIVAVESLIPGASYQSLLTDLEKHSKRTQIALVGHEPALGELAAHLIGIGELAARLAGSRHPFEFKKGAICRVDVDSLPPGGPGKLRWFITPRILRSIRK